MPARFSVDDQMAEALSQHELMGNRQRKNFLKLFRKYSKLKKTSIDWNNVKPPTDSILKDNNTVESCPNDMNLRHELLDKLVILKLNGGLGTTLGCEGPKSAIEVRQDLSFLDLTVRQVEYLNSVYGVDVPLVLMNSFNTHEETYLSRFAHGIPNIMELDHLTVAGDVKFGSDISLKGTVILVANEGAHIDLPDGTVLENKVVTGNLRILDH
ncbi:hypothetical protein BBJ29_003088 [Phytophthora kernoviae]|uniref:UTP--glucose-1-phosphate uridylyltransferase n=1 Tax=Phytophthora kernoviae TaxID=325452 RepID=A0A3F2S0L3_9STRA|nr:hypothetical protein BBJ29_003088 [Phytophthora kernoviae]RLN67940.1 hypothetical protein BBP00_00001344 [Phytophthora kernoviae]